ncbi:hypothetical protein MLD38_038612 [Melastoma candidum]|uniref:Uncharacterized protein n=1 Tax=Melastoma candidum TaxID=119954 RepID=A0ACB9KZG1_9MYRT|nr:hypothetical protein MLD38_038612 [Melastoma candidum]
MEGGMIIFCCSSSAGSPLVFFLEDKDQSLWWEFGGLCGFHIRGGRLERQPGSEGAERKKRVVVLGTGWAGTSFLKDLDISTYDVQVVSPRNYFVFTPLLPSVTSGTVEARSIVDPTYRGRGASLAPDWNSSLGVTVLNGWALRNKLLADCLKIDAANNKVFCRSNLDENLAGDPEFSLEFDYLVVAVGAQANTFNTPGVLENCHFLKIKEVDDAQKIRRSVIDRFEKSVLPGLTEEENKKNLHFVIVGGGPTESFLGAILQDEIHCISFELQIFDERISTFAKLKFIRDGIDVQTGCRVLGISDKEITMKTKSKGEVRQVPYGLVVLSTGVGPRPIVQGFMEQIDQGKRRMLATDEWLRDKGTENVYALGTIDQRKIVDDILSIFKAADKDNSGTLTIEEFQDVRDADGNPRKEVDFEGFKEALCLVDSQRKSLPATARVAAQQGSYLTKCFNHREQCAELPEGPRQFHGSGRHQFHPFWYKHLGQFAPLGGEQAATELPGDWVSMGCSTQWLWYSVYASKQVSWRTRFLVVSDWTRRFVFGRDSSRI